jgi:hypothetical protein
MFTPKGSGVLSIGFQPVFWRTERCFSSSRHFDHSGIFLIVLVVVVVLLILPVKESN